MNATPENFLPGQQWLCASEYFGNVDVREVECLRWSESGKYVKVRRFYWDSESGKRMAEVQWISKMPELLERLPDVESGNHKTGSSGRFEAASREWPCTCDHCATVKAAIKEAERRERAGKAADFFAECCGCEECKKKLEANAETKA